MGEIMSKEKDARDVALREYDTFMGKYKANVEAGDMKLMMHMLRLEADQIRTQSVVDAIENSEAVLDKTVYSNTKMKMQMSEEEYNIDQGIKPVDEREQAFIKMATKDTTKGEPTPTHITIGDPDEMVSVRMDAYDFGQLPTPSPKRDKQEGAGIIPKRDKQEETGIVVDPETGKKVYKGPALRSRKVVDGKEWDTSHPNFHDKGVGGM